MLCWAVLAVVSFSGMCEILYQLHQFSPECQAVSQAMPVTAVSGR